MHYARMLALGNTVEIIIFMFLIVRVLSSSKSIGYKVHDGSYTN